MTVAETTSRPWWVTALVASLVSMGLVALALYLPPGRGTVVLVVGAIVFVIVLFKNPAFWRRRLAGMFVGASVVLAAAPKLRVFVKDEGLGYLFFDGGTSIVVILVLGGIGVLFAALETLAERRPAGPRSIRAEKNVVQGDNNQVATHDVGNDWVEGDKNETHHHAPVQNFSGPVTIAAAGEAVLTEARRHGVNLDDYLDYVLREVDHIEIKGISESARGAMREPIESLYTPLRSRDLRLEDVDAAGEAPRRRPAEGEEEHRVLLPELLSRHRRLLLVGKPGSGKTTFIHLVACMLARDLRAPRPADAAPWREEHLGLSRAEPPPIPALIWLRELVDDLLTCDPQAKQPSDRHWILRRLADMTRPADARDDHGCDERQEQWGCWLADGAAILLLDGLDEVADPALRKRVLAIVRASCETWPKCQVIVTSRPIFVEAMTAAPLRFHRADIDDFGAEEVERFVGQWSRALYNRQPALSAENTRSLVAAIGGRPELRELARNPVVLTCLCVIHYNEKGELPSGRARVYQAIVRWMLRAREGQRLDLFLRGGPLPGSPDGRDLEAASLAEDALQRLALAMMEGTARRPGKVASIHVSDGAAAIEGEILRYFPGDRVPPRERAERWLRRECELSALIEEVSGHQIKFWHLTIQEFLAARAIARRSDWWREIERHLDDPQWDKVVDLFSGCLFVGERDRVDELVEKILDRGEGKGLRMEAETLVHVERVLEPMGAFGYREDPALVRRQEALRDRVMGIFTKEGAAEVPVRTRVAAAEVIGRWGDPRLAEGVDNFVEVPGTGLRMGRYPVTVAEYGRFVAAEGYREGCYWDEAGAAWKDEYGRHEPWSWEEQQEHPSRPVVGVSWHEARAYCRWLSTGLGGGWKARLPSADAWERAATPAKGEYPWGAWRTREGEAPDDDVIVEHLANFKKSIGAPTPVGVYPAGAGPYGHLDLAGNVCEWCEDGPPGQVDRRWLKGGSWYGHDRGALVAAFCSGRWRVAGGADIGFRGVVAREPS